MRWSVDIADTDERTISKFPARTLMRYSHTAMSTIHPNRPHASQETVKDRTRPGAGRQAKHEDPNTQRSRQREERGFNAGEFENGKAQ